MRGTRWSAALRGRLGAAVGSATLGASLLAGAAWTGAGGGDRTAPTPPAAVGVERSTRTTLTLAWHRSRDRVGVVGYRVFVDGKARVSTARLRATVGGLACGHSYAVGVAAFDNAHNVSRRVTRRARTAACAAASAPSLPFGPAIATPASVPTTALAPTAAGGGGGGGDGGGGGGGGVTLDAAVDTSTADAPDAAPVDPTNAGKPVVVGTGYVESNARQVVRTPAGVVYVFSADDTAQRTSSGPGVARAWKGNAAGIPTAFAEIDGAHRPTAGSANNVIVDVDARLDRSGIVHLVYVDETTATLYYRTFSTLTDTWGPTTTLAASITVPDGFFRRLKRSVGAASIALDAVDNPHVVYAAGNTIYYRTLAGGAWTAPQIVFTGGRPIHEQLAFGPDWTLHLSWLEDNATTPRVRYSYMPLGGTWQAKEEVDSGANVQDNATGDQSPSIVVTSSGVPYILWINQCCTSAVRIRYRTGPGTWTADDPPTNLYTHAPDIYAQGDDIYAVLGHDSQIRFGYQYHLSGQAWGPYIPMTTTADGALDGSASVRWDPPRETNPNVIDAAFFDEDTTDDGNSFLPRVYYMAILPSGTPDTTAPTAPAELTVTARTLTSVSLSWAASTDAIGVVGYGVYQGVTRVAQPAGTTSTVTSLECGTTYSFGVDAVDAADNRSTVTVLTASTLPCPDTTAPVTSDDAPSGWRNGPVTVTLTATDGVGSGVAATEYELDGAGSFTTGTSVVVTGEGVHTIAYRSTDVAGNVEAVRTATVRIDATAPVTGDDAPSGWRSGTVTVTLTATDAASGVAAVEYKLDAAPAFATGSSVVVSGEGVHTVTYRSTDAAGNVEAEKTATVRIDATAPVTSDDAPAGWHDGPVTVALSAGDSGGSGLATTEYKVDGAAAFTTGATVAVAGDGVHTVSYRSTDSAGNVEAEKTATVRIDTTAPSTSDDAPTAWSNAAVTVTLSASDAGSGVATTEYKVDGAAAWSGGGSVSVPAPADHSNDGVHTITYRSTDALGHVEPDRSATVRIDTIAPATVDDAPAGWRSGPVLVTLIALDGGGSGVTRTEYELDGATEFTTGTTVAVSGGGVHTIGYRSTDAAGNVEAVRTATVEIDTTPPVTTDDAPAGWRNGPVTVTLTADDGGGSGVVNTEYKLDGAAAFSSGASVAVAGEGVHTIEYRSTDAAGNVEPVKTATVRIDTTAPSTVDDAPAGWSRTPVTVVLSASDSGGSGVAATAYSVDGSAWSSGSSVTIAADGVHTIAYRSTDAAGNVEAERTATVRIDAVSPVTSDDAPAGWRSGPVLVTLTAIDGVSGVTRTEYELDGAVTFTTGTTVAVAGEGVHTIMYRSVDAAGNVEAERTATVRIDATAPVTSDDAPAGWRNGPVTVTLSAADSGGSGVASIEYKLDGAAAFGSGGSVAVSGEGVHTIEYRSTDAAGNVEAVKTATVRIDTTAPATTDDAPTGWSNAPVTVTLTAGDTGGSGLAKTEYKVDGAASFTTGTSIAVSGEGVHTVTYRSADAAGNVEAERTATVRIDSTAPVTSDDAPSGWRNGPVTVTLTAADAGSGVATTEYKLDGAASFVVGSSVAVSGEGVHTIAYRSNDGAGNVETEKTATVQIDTTAPVTTDDAPAGWRNGPVTVTLTATDSGGSGVAKTEFSVDGGGWSTGTSVSISSDGVHAIAYRSTDAAGNVEAEKTATVRIDTVAPASTDDAPSGWRSGPVLVTLSGFDAASGVTRTEFELDGAAAFTTGTTVVVAGEGVHTIVYRSVDAAGNIEAERTATVRIDSTAPVTSDDAPAGWRNGPVTVTLSAVDSGGSGMAATEFKLDAAAVFTTGTAVVVPGEGVHTITYRSTDRAGNVEAEKTATVRIDTTVPVTSDDAPSGWRNGPVTVTLSASDAGGSGVAATEYRVDAAETFVAGASVAVATEGVHTIAYRSVDAAGNVEAQKTATVRIDTTAPVTTDDAPAGWRNGPVTVTLTATDARAGVAATEYSLDGATFSAGTSITVSGEGVHTIVYRSTDAAGNVEVEKTAAVRIDTTAPVTSDDAPAGWRNTPVTVTLTATDAGAGVAATGYRLDGAATFAAGPSVTVSSEGVHTIVYRSTDAAGNVEAEKTATVRIDTTAPTTSDDAPAGWRSGPALVSLSAADAASGVTRTEYRVDDTAGYTTGTSVLVAGQGVYTIAYRSTDAAGNVEAEKTATLRIDTTAPSTSDDAPAGWRNGPVTVTLSAADEGGSGVAATEYKLDASETFVVGTSVAVSGEGVHTITYRSTDTAGNVEAEKTATVRIDTTAPVTTDDAPAGWSAGAVTVALTATDARAGVASTEFKVDDAAGWSSGASVAIPAPADHSNDGPHTITFRSTDAAGNVEAPKTATVRIDTMAPVTTDDAAATWSKSAVTVTLTATDASSGVAATEFKLDGAPAFSPGSSVAVSGHGVHTIVYRSTDAAGNVESERTATVRIDTIAPTTSDEAPAGWRNGPVTVTLSATDADSGIALTEFRIDEAAAFTAGTSVTVSGEGVHTIAYRSSDAAGNVEAEKTATVRIDTTAPVTTDDAPAGWRNGPVLVSLSAVDGASGVTKTEYKVDDAAGYTTGTSVLVAGEGVHTIAYRSTDAAGNAEAERTATVRIDATAPVTADDAPAEWRNTPVTVALTAADAGGSGVAATEYRVDGAAAWTTGTSIAIAAEGVHTIAYRSTDAAGNVEAEKTATVRIDTTAPTTTADAPAGWSATAVTVTLSATDAGGSGVAATEYKVDGAPAWSTGASVTVAADGVHTVAYRSTDVAGNAEAEKQATVRVDTTAPTTTDDATAGWSNGPVTVRLTPADAGSGVAATEYRLDGAGAWSTGTSIPVSGEGVHTIAYRSTDAVGNVETEKTATVRIDLHAPVTTDDAPAAWSNVPVTVMLSATDTGGSELVATQYRIDGAPAWSTGTSLTIAAEGVHTIAYRSIDAAGNVEAEKTATVRIDTTAPATTDDAPAAWRNAPVTVTLAATDAASGVRATEYRVDGTSTFTAGTSVTVSGEGVHTIAYRSADAAGNVEAEKTATVRIDTTAPVTTDDAPATWRNTPVTVTLTAADAAPGGTTTQYRLDGAAAWSDGSSVTVAAPADHSNDGVHTIAYRSTDAAGNVEAEKQATVQIDTTAPTSDDAPMLWTSGPAVVILRASDGASGVARTEYKVDGAASWSVGAVVVIAAPADHSNDGAHTVTYRATDAAGNIGDEKQASVTIDTTAPVTTDDAPSGWSPSAVTVTLTATDAGPGAPTTAYKVDGAADWTPGTTVVVPAPADHSNDGVHTIAFRSTDAVGNVEAERQATVRIDTAAPVTADDAPGGWSIAPVTVTLTAADAGSGVAATEYRVDDAASWSTGTTIAIARDGVHTIRYRSSDLLGHVEAERTATVRIDTRAPVTTDDAPSGWMPGPVVVALAAVDETSGVTRTEHRMDGAASWTAGTSVFVSGDGVHAISFRSIDVAGNVEAEKTATVRIDTTAPVTTDDTPAGWRNGAVTVALSARDTGGSGVATTEYRVDGAPAWSTGTSVTVAADGVHTIAYRSTDAVGNVEAEKTATVKVDTIAPVTTDDAPPGWSNGPVTVTLTAADGGSGVGRTEYRLDAAADWSTGTSVLVAGDGVHSIAYRSLDVAGNAEAEQTATVRIDTTAPATTDDAPAGWRNGAVTVMLTATDTGGSGVATTEYRVDGAAAWVTGTSVTVASDGVHTIAYRSTDAVGNVEAEKRATVRVDTTAPSTTDDAPAGWRNAPVTVTLTAADGGSGVAATQYRVDGAAAWSDGSSVAVPAPADHSNDGVHTIAYRSIDAVGNVEAQRSATVWIDTLAPTSDDAPEIWTAGPALVVLRATDGASGVVRVEYRVDAAASWTTGTLVLIPAPADHSNDGLHTIRYRSTDAAGNVAPEKQTAVRIDTAAPTTTDDAPAGWSRSAVTVTLTALDAVGVAGTEYSLDGAASFTPGTSVVVPAPADHSNDGVHTIRYRSTDYLGHVEAERQATVRIDTTAPVTTDDAPAWSNSPVTVALTASDTGSGVARVEYRLDGAAAFTTGGNAEVSGEGVHTLAYRATDAAGNVEAEEHATVRIDTTAPVTSDNAPVGWSSGPVLVALSAIDGASGVTRTEYRVDGAAAFTTGTNVAVAGEGVHTIAYRSTDAAGNVEAEEHATVRIDLTAPVTSDDAPAGWSTEALTVTLTGTDIGGSGVAATEYRVDGASAWSTGTAVPLATDGVHTIAYRSIDAVGHVEVDKQVTVRLDTIAPATTDDAPAGWSSGPVLVALVATDDGSGVTGTEYRVDGAAAYTLGTLVAIGAPADHSNDGVHTIAYRSRDVAGSIEEERTATVRIDTSAPSTTDDAPAGWSKNAVTVTLSPADAGSGVAATEFKLDGASDWSAGTAVVVPAPADHSNDGVHTIRYRSTDRLGHVEEEKQTTVRIDTQLPSTTDDAPAGWRDGPVTVTLTAADAGGAGLAATEYRLDGAAAFSTGASVTVTAEGVHTIAYRSADTAGNVEPDRTATVRIDTTAPATTDDAPAGWSRNAVTVALSASDALSGVAITEYKVDDASTWSSGSSVGIAAPADHSNDGVHTIAYRSTDAVGNVEAVHTATVRIDTTAPATANDAPAAWRNGAVTVTLSATDTGGSGVATTEYKVDGATTWSAGTSVTVATDGVHTITYRSTDAIGNVEPDRTATVRIDTRAPATTDDAPAGWHNAPVTVDLTAVDAGGAGVATTEHRLDGAAAWSPGTSVTVPAPADHSNDGTHTIAYRSTDTAGNVEAEKTATVRIDTQQPATTDDAPTGPRNTAVTVTLAPVDAGGAGVASTEYKLDAAAAWSTGISITVAAPADHSNDGAHTIAYRSTDAAGNVEETRTATVVIDTTAPTAPTAVVVTASSETSVTLGWAPSTDAVGVTGYGTYNGLTPATQATDTSATIGGLDCGTAYTVGIDATDAAGNRSARTDIPVTTACAPGSLSISPTGSDYVWSHLAATYDGATVRLYVNGVQVSSKAAPGAMTASTDPLRIGAGEGGDEWFDGLIDNVRIYSRALTQAEIAANMLVPVTTATTALAPGLVAAYSFDEGAGTTATDVSGHGHTGTLDGATWSTSGEFGGALDFDGTSDVVSVPDDNALDLTNGMTLEAWVHPSSLEPIWRNVIMKQQGTHLAYALYANAQPLAAGQVSAPSAHVYVNGQEYIARAGTSLPPNRCTLEPCATFGHAYLMAAPGNVVDVAGGTYPEQTLMFDPTKTSADDVVFRPAPGATVTAGGFDIGTDRNTGGASHVTLRNMTVDGDISIPGCGVPDGTACPADDASPANDLTFKNLRVKGTTAFFCASCSNISIIGGTWGPDTYACRPGSGSAHPEISSAQGQVKRAHGILIDGVTWQNFARCDAAVDHTECLQVEPADDLTIRNSVFRMCDTIGVNLANDLANAKSAAGYRAPNNVLIENNVFDRSRDFTGGETFYALNIRECTNCTVRYNSWIQAPRMPNGEIALNVKFVGNVGPFGQGTCLPTVTFAYNVWEGAKCSATDKNVAAAGFADPAALDLALVTGSPAIGAGDPSDFPPLDARGKPRTSVPDAGAYQH